MHLPSAIRTSGILTIAIICGCNSSDKQQESQPPKQQEAQVEKPQPSHPSAKIKSEPQDPYSAAMIYMIGEYGSCGTGVTGVTETDQYWIAKTVYGIGAKAGPTLHIDKKTFGVTVAPTPGKPDA